MLGESNGPALAGIRPAPLCREYGRKSRRMVASASNLPRWVAVVGLRTPANASTMYDTLPSLVVIYPPNKATFLLGGANKRTSYSYITELVHTWYGAWRGAGQCTLFTQSTEEGVACRGWYQVGSRERFEIPPLT